MGKHHEEGRDARSRTYSFNFSITRTDPDDIEETKASWVKTLKPVDLVMLAGLLVIFLVEPFAIYMYLTRHLSPVIAGRCADGSRVVVAQYPEPAGYVQGLADQQDVITPLNVRDPSSLIMGPAPAYEYSAPRRTSHAPSSAWKDATAAAAKARKAEPAEAPSAAE